MPKSAHMANAHAKVAAAAIVAELAGSPVDAHPMLTNTCYSFVSDSEAIHVASVHEFVGGQADFQVGARLGRGVVGTLGDRGRVRARLGGQHLGRYAGVIAQSPGLALPAVVE